MQTLNTVIYECLHLLAIQWQAVYYNCTIYSSLTKLTPSSGVYLGFEVGGADLSACKNFPFVRIRELHMGWARPL